MIGSVITVCVTLAVTGRVRHGITSLPGACSSRDRANPCESILDSQLPAACFFNAPSSCKGRRSPCTADTSQNALDVVQTMRRATSHEQVQQDDHAAENAGGKSGNVVRDGRNQGGGGLPKGDGRCSECLVSSKTSSLNHSDAFVGMKATRKHAPIAGYLGY